MVTGDVNYLAVLIAAIVSMAVGAYWYSPAGFGKQWASLSGLGDISKMNKKGASKSYVWMFVAALISAFVLANVVLLAAANTLVSGAMVGFWVWLGFVATTQIGSVLWESKPPKLFGINTGYSLVTFLINGAILAMWTM